MAQRTLITNRINYKTMKIYISGKISGIPYPNVVRTFNDAQDFLESLGFDVVNPLNNGLPPESEWNKHMARDIELLLECDSIYMMNNWRESVGASIEYDVAIRTKKSVWFESNVVRDNDNVCRIKNAIHSATGLTFAEYITQSRQRDLVYARMLFAHFCRKAEINVMNIASMINRDHASVVHALNKFIDEYRYNANFKTLAKRVESILNDDSSI